MAWIPSERAANSQRTVHRMRGWSPRSSFRSAGPSNGMFLSSHPHANLARNAGAPRGENLFHRAEKC